MEKPKAQRYFIFYTFFLAFVIRFIHLIFSIENPLLYMPVLDERFYLDFATRIAAGSISEANSAFFMDPLYSYFLSGVFFIFGEDLLAVRVIQIFLDAANVLLIYCVGSKVCKKDAAIVGALGYAVYPVSFFYSLLILKTTLSITMLLVFTLCLLNLLEKDGSWYGWAGLGMLSALLTWLRGNMLLLVPLIIFLMPLYERIRWYSLFNRGLFLICGFFFLLSLGGLKQYMLGGEFILFNTQSGRLFYSCNNPENLTGRYNVPGFAHPDPMRSEKDFHEEAEFRTGRALTPSEVSHYWMKETFRFFIHHPETIFTLLYHKIMWTASQCEIATNHSYYCAARFSPLLKWWPTPFALIFSLGLPGLILAIGKNRRAAVLLVPLLTVGITMLLFYASSRFRVPAVPYLMIGAGVTLCMLKDWIKKRNILKSVAMTSVVAGLGACSLSVSCPKPSGTDTFLLSKAYWHQKDYSKARQFAMKGQKEFPEQARFHILLGMIAFSMNRFDEAIQHYEKALCLDPKNTDALHNMGLIYLKVQELGKPEGYYGKR